MKVNNRTEKKYCLKVGFYFSSHKKVGFCFSSHKKVGRSNAGFTAKTKNVVTTKKKNILHIYSTEQSVFGKINSMDDVNRAEVELVIKCGTRRKAWYNMCRTTTRQEFIKHMDNWLGDDLPPNYTTSFYNKGLKTIIQLNDNEEYYLAPIFDSVSFGNQVVGVQPFVANDGCSVDVFISDKDSAIFSNLSSEAFAGNDSF